MIKHVRRLLVVASGMFFATSFVLSMDTPQGHRSLAMCPEEEGLKKIFEQQVPFMLDERNEQTFKAVLALRQVAAKTAEEFKKYGFYLDAANKAPVPEESFDQDCRNCMCGNCYKSSGCIALKECGILFDMGQLRILTPWGIAPLFKQEVGNAFPGVLAGFRLALFRKLNLIFNNFGKVERPSSHQKFGAKSLLYTLRSQDIDPHALCALLPENLYEDTAHDSQLAPFVKMPLKNVEDSRRVKELEVSPDDSSSAPFIEWKGGPGALYEVVRVEGVSIPQHERWNDVLFDTHQRSLAREIFEYVPDALSVSSACRASTFAWKAWMGKCKQEGELRLQQEKVSDKKKD